MALQPPYRAAFHVVAGMTWARAAIFYGSDAGRCVGLDEMLSKFLLYSRSLCHSGYLLAHGAPSGVATVAPPLLLSIGVQAVNMPLVRCSIMLQDPQTKFTSVSGQSRVTIATLYRRWLPRVTPCHLVSLRVNFACSFRLLTCLVTRLQPSGRTSLPVGD